MKIQRSKPISFAIFVFLISSWQLPVSGQKHKITISPNQHFVSLEMKPANYQYLIDNNATVLWDSIKDFTNDIYMKFDDKFDMVAFLFNTSGNELRSKFGFYGLTSVVSNSVEGLGLGIYNNSSIYGSAGKLKSLIIFTANTDILYGPSLHEICHTWANYGIPTKSWNGTEESDISGHWGFTGGSTKGQLGGFQQSTLQTNIDGNPNKYSVASFGTFANGGNSVPYNKLELYLMGMIPVTDVPDFDVFSGLTQADVVSSNIEFTASTRTTYNPAKIESVLGSPRIPSSATSQKNFRILFVLITPTPVDNTLWTTLDFHSEQFGIPGSDGTSLYNFWEATGGLGTMETGNLLDALKGTLPIRLITFSAQLQKNGIVGLNWSTASESNNDFFTIERSDNMIDWVKVTEVQSKGNSLSTQSYLATDHIPVGIFYYRLKQTDIDGNYSYSKIVEVDNKASKSNIIVFPNPATNKVTISGENIDKFEIYLTDLRGQKISIRPTLQTNKVTFDVSALAKGIYFIHYKSETQTGTKKIIVR